MENVVIIAVLVLIVAGILFYLHRAKSRGEACIGCPHAKACRGKCQPKGGPENTSCH